MRTPLIAAAVALATAPAAGQLPQYALADSVARAVPAHATTSVDSLALYLGRGLTRDADRARAIYRWVTENIDYDARAFFGNRMNVPIQGPEQVLRRRRAICDGYSGLVWALGRRMGLEVEVVQGWAKGGNGVVGGEARRGGHSWNAVRLEGEWRLVDATWGAGDLIGRDFIRRVREFYFLADPEKLAFSHLPRDARWQLLPDPLSSSEFDRQPSPTRDFWDLGWEAAAVRGAGTVLVGTYPIADRPIRVRQAPAAGRLAPGATVPLALEAPGASEVVAVSGDHWQPLAPLDGIFSGEAAMAADRLVVMVRYPDRPDGTIVLEWKASGR